jgi:diguanylate cyclase (GGDEF)-like protein
MLRAGVEQAFVLAGPQPYHCVTRVEMGWFSKGKGGKATGADAAVLRDALVTLLRHIEGELPRADSKRLHELLERVETFPVPTGMNKQAIAVVKALRSAGVGAGSADVADALRAMAQAMQRVSIHDQDLTKSIAALEKSVPLRVRNVDARSLEVNAKALEQSAQAARFRQTQSYEAVYTIINTLEAQLGKAMEANLRVEKDLEEVKLLVSQMDNPVDFPAKKEAILVALKRISDGNSISRARVDQGVARTREIGHTIRLQTGGKEDMRVKVSIDALTQVADRPAFLEALPLALTEARYKGGILTCMRFNVDGMQDINERYHRSSGDDVLRTVANTVVKQLRAEDFVARLDADDFAALLPNTGAREAKGAAKRLGRKVEKMIFTHQTQTFAVGISIGIATWDGKESAESLFARCENALSQAKKKGGGQYWVSTTLQA